MKLDPFLTDLPEGWRFAVEVRNPELLQRRYFECLRAHNVTHVYNAWEPNARDQRSNGDPGLPNNPDLIVARALLKRAARMKKQ